MTLQVNTWQQYLAEVQSWQHIDLDEHDVRRLTFLMNCYQDNQSPLQAAIGWELVQKAERNYSAPHKLRRAAARVAHRGRVTRRRQRRRLKNPAEVGRFGRRLTRQFADVRLTRERKEDSLGE